MNRKWMWGAVTGTVAAALVVAVLVVTLPWTDASSSGRRDVDAVADLSTQPADIVADYRYVESHPEMARQIPCYCGCGKSLGHLDLLDCYVIRKDVYSEHATGCMICGEEARALRRLSDEGESLPAIRAWIDSEYSRFGPPTNTPRIEEGG